MMNKIKKMSLLLILEELKEGLEDEDEKAQVELVLARLQEPARKHFGEFVRQIYGDHRDLKTMVEVLSL